MNTKNSIVTFIYTIFLALLISLFIGLGVSAFYPAPTMPKYESVMEKYSPGDESPGNKKTLEDYNKAQAEYQKKSENYNRNVSMIILTFSVISLVVGLLFIGKISLISDGLMLGGVFTLIYSIIRGFATEDARFRFVIVAIGLIITLFVGYIKFIKPTTEK